MGVPLTPVAFVAGETHFLDHVAPVYKALPADLRGPFVVPASLAAKARLMDIEPVTYKVDAEVKGLLLNSGASAVVVASWGDLKRAQTLDPKKPGSGIPIVYMEHGAGFSWGGDMSEQGKSARTHPSYAGSPSRPGVALFLVPGPHPAMRNKAAHPDIPNEIIGCPKLDKRHSSVVNSPLLPHDFIYLNGSGEHGPEGDPYENGDCVKCDVPWSAHDEVKPVVAVTWHWPSNVCPETGNAWEHQKSGLDDLVKDGRWTVIGHAHPRAMEKMPGILETYERLGIELVDDLDEIFDRADLLVADATSAIYEFASLDKPVVLLNAPQFRKHVNHGLRFWDAAHVGPQVDHPSQLVDAVAEALQNTPEQQAVRQHAVSMVYAYTDGKASERAAKAITKFVNPRHGFLGGEACKGCWHCPELEVAA